MIVVKAVLVILFVGLVPLVLGHFITQKMGEKYVEAWSANWLMGIVLMFAQLQIIALPLIIYKCKFHTLFYLYVAIIAVETIMGVFRYTDNLRRMARQLVPRLKELGLLWVLVVISIMMQAFMLSYFEHVDDDDARYVPTAVAAVQKDLMLVENPVTGQPLYSEFSEVFKDMVSPWIMFWALLSKVSMIHPAILMHSIVPLFMIPLAYVVYWLLAQQLFEEDEKRVIFVGLVSAMSIFSGYSLYNSGAFLLFRIWQGKAMFAAIFVPLHFLLALRLYRTEGKIGVRDCVTVGVCCCAACLTSGFGIILSGLFWGVMSLIYGIGKRDFRGMCGLWLAMIPCAVYAFLYAFGAKIFMAIKFYW